MIRPRRCPCVLRRALPLLVALFIGTLACGPTRPDLPAPRLRGPLPEGDAQAGAALRRDRALGRSGFACADCHAVDAPRPGPSLVGARADQIDWCVERFMRRPALSARQVADLQAAPPPRPAAWATTGEALYAQQCAHCHADGRAPQIIGRPWPRDHLRAVIRGTDRPAHPDTLMPPFAPSVLDENALKRLVDHVVDQSADGRAFLPAVVGLSEPRMMVGSR